MTFVAFPAVAFVLVEAPFLVGIKDSEASRAFDFVPSVVAFLASN